MKSAQFPSRKHNRSREKGQIIVEYVLLLVVGVGIVVLITTLMVSRNPDNPGFVIKKWLDIITTIGGDSADDLTNKN